MAFNNNPAALAYAISVAYGKCQQAVDRCRKNLGNDLDATYREAFFPLGGKEITEESLPIIRGLAAMWGTTFKDHLEDHYKMAVECLEQEKANGDDSSKHPWAFKVGDGYVPSTPIGIVYAVNPDGSCQSIDYVQPPVAPTVTVDSPAYDRSQSTALGFKVTNGAVGASYAYTITSSGGGAPVTGTGDVVAETTEVNGLNASTLPDGMLTIAVTVVDRWGRVSPATSITTTLSTQGG